MLQTTQDEIPTLIISFDDFFYWARSPYKIKEICDLLWDIKRCHVKLVLLTQNMELAKKTLREAYDYAEDRLFEDLKEFRDPATKKQIISGYVAPYKILSPANNQKLVIFDSDKESKKLTVQPACKLYVISQKEDWHIAKLRKTFDRFRVHKTRFEAQQLQKSSKKAEQEFAEMKINYHYTKAKSALVGEIYSFLTVTKMKLSACRVFSRTLPTGYFISAIR